MKIPAAAVLLALLWPAAAFGQSQGWQNNQVAQDDISLAPYQLFFPRGNPWSTIPSGSVTPGASISMYDNSFTVYDTQLYTGSGSPRINNQGTGDLIIASGTTRILLATSANGGGAHVSIGTTEDSFIIPLVGPAATSTSQTGPFFYLGSVAGTPTALPYQAVQGATDMVPLVMDTSGKLLWWYDWTSSSWRSIGSGGAGTVTAVSATNPLFITGGSSPTPNVTIQGSIVSGSTSTSSINLGTSVVNAMLACSTSGSTCTPTAVTVSGGLAYNAGTGTETLANFSCSAGQAVNAATTGGGLACTPIQAPLVCGTDYLSLTCVSGATDLGGTNTTPTVIGAENDAAMRGDLLATAITAPSTPASGKARIYIDSTTKNLVAINDAGTKNHGIQSGSCFIANTLVSGISDNGTTTCSAPVVACAGLPALVGDTTSTAGTCGTTVVGIHESGGLGIPIGACTTDGQAFVKVSGQMTCRLPGGDLSNDYTAPWAIGLHDGASAQWTYSGTWATGQVMVTAASSHVTTQTTAALFSGRPGMDLTYYLELTPAILTTITGGNQYVATSSSIIVTPGVIEYPVGGDFVPQSCKISAKIDGSNTITSGSLSFAVLVNGSGSPLASTCAVTLTSASSGVVNSGLALYSGSPSSSDTIGVQASPNGSTIIASGTLRLALRVRVSPELSF